MVVEGGHEGAEFGEGGAVALAGGFGRILFEVGVLGEVVYVGGECVDGLEREAHGVLGE